jgi:acetylserotonin N-methyltransferase
MAPDAGIVLKLIEAFRWSQTMFAATSLGVFDYLAADGPSPVTRIAEALHTDVDATERLLDGCVSLQLLEKRASGSEYANTPTADRYLRGNSPDTLAGYILYSHAALVPMWSHLDDAVREGTHRWTQTFGPQRELFAHFFKTDESMRTFLQGMHGLGMLGSPLTAAAHDLSGFRRFVDLGGATGHLAVEVKRRYPAIQCAVFDLPRVIGVAREFVASTGLDIELIPGDFFADPLPEADLFAVGRILHDWSDETAVRLLRKMYEVLPVGGGVLICEHVLEPEKTGSLHGLMQSLNMLVVTEGKERNEAEYRALLQAAGFDDIVLRRTGGPVDAILARKQPLS